MAPYLPQTGAVGGGSPYSEGGALYALGLIHANHGEGIKQFLRESLRNTNAEVLFSDKTLGTTSVLRFTNTGLKFFNPVVFDMSIYIYRSSSMVHAWDWGWQPWEQQMK